MNTAHHASPTVVVLAAGASTRLGRPKALVEINGRSVLSALLGAAQCEGGSVVVVTGAHHAEIVAHLALDERVSFSQRTGALTVVHNTNWSAGRTSSVQCAVRAAPLCDLVIAPVDVPRVNAATFDVLRRAWQTRGAPALGWLAPAVLASDGTRRFGHPVVIGRELAALLEDSPPDRPLAALRLSAEPLLFVDVQDPRVLEDLDTPRDLVELRRRAAAELG